jgi:hypothetical protein
MYVHCSILKNAYPVGLELRKMIRAAIPQMAGDEAKVKPAVKAEMPHVSEKVQAANSKLAESM